MSIEFADWMKSHPRNGRGPCRDCHCEPKPFEQTTTITATVATEPDLNPGRIFFGIQQEGSMPGCTNPRYASVHMDSNGPLPEKGQMVRLTGSLHDDGDFQVRNAEDMAVL